jgi:dihydroorotate dehydrogenase (NAD+) catalytic subunit
VGEIARACEAEGADALSLVNTMNAMAINVHTSRSGGSQGQRAASPAPPSIPSPFAWCGRPRRLSRIPINGIGGVATGEDAAEMILAGATTVSVGTANLYDPAAASRVLDELEALGCASRAYPTSTS